MRNQQTIKFPLSKVSQVKVRADYKKHNGLAKNSTLESVYRSLGIFNEKQASNVMAEMYNNRIEKDNQNVDVKRQEKKISIKSGRGSRLRGSDCSGKDLEWYGGGGDYITIMNCARGYKE